MRTYMADVSGRISPTDDIQGRYAGWRVSASQAAATATAAVLNSDLQLDSGKRDVPTIALTDLMVYAQAAGATVTVKSVAPDGSVTDIMAEFLVGVGSTAITLRTALVADKGDNLVVTIATAGTACSILALGRVL